jgi:hypothetical protein
VPAGIVVTSIGSHLLRGKSERLELFALERDTPIPVDRDDNFAGWLQGDTADASSARRGSSGHADPLASRQYRRPRQPFSRLALRRSRVGL